MRATDLEKIESLYFSNSDIAKILSISYDSAKVSASRYTKKNILTRIKPDVYILTNRFKRLTQKEIFQLANMLQTPSYISLTSALSYYQITTQVQQSFVESVCLKRTLSTQIHDTQFVYSRVKKPLYRGFLRNEEFFIALPEKALADAVYLTSIKRYSCDFDAIDFDKLELSMVDSYIQSANSITSNFWSQLCKTYTL